VGPITEFPEPDSPVPAPPADRVLFACAVYDG